MGMQWEPFPGTFSKPWANSGLGQSFRGSLSDIKPSFPSSGSFQALGSCRNAHPNVFALLHIFSSSLQGWECNTWGSLDHGRVRMELGRDLDGILQKFRWKIAED